MTFSVALCVLLFVMSVWCPSDADEGIELL